MSVPSSELATRGKRNTRTDLQFNCSEWIPTLLCLGYPTVSYTKDRSVRVLRFRRVANSLLGTDIVQSSHIITLVRTRTGESNPRWKTQVKRMANATTLLTGTFDTYQDSFANAEVVYQDLNVPFGTGKVQSVRAKGQLAAFPTIDWNPSITTNTADNRALIAYLKNAKQAQSSFAGPTFLGELRESLRMLRRPALGLRNILSDYISRAKLARKGLPPGKRGDDLFKRELSSLWLETVFGVIPLVNDVNAAFKTFRGLRDRKPAVPISGYGIEKMPVPGRTYRQQNSSGWATYMLYVWNQNAYEQAFVKYSGVVSLKTVGSPVDALEPFGFTWNSFVPTAWELLPWSFLIDYFSNIGDVLEAGTFSRSDLQWTRRTTVTRQELSLNGKFQPSFSFAQVAASGRKCLSATGTDAFVRITRNRVKREPAIQPGIPTLTFEIPGSPAQWANMVALWTQANSVHPQRRY